MNTVETPQNDLEELLQLAKEIAISGAVVHRSGLEKVISAHTKSTELDLVSEIDIETERVIVENILRKRPNDSIIGEEGNNHSGNSGICWIIDPLDGTVNYLHHYPAFGISIGIEVDNVGVVGVVYDTYREQMYCGSIDRKAVCDGKNISVSDCDFMQSALIGTGFLPNREVRVLQGKILAEVLPNVLDIRRSGSPVIDLCRVASGVLDGFYEFGLKKWDISAGGIIAQSADAKVTILPVGDVTNPLIVVSTPKIHEELLELVLKAWKKHNQ